MQCPLVHGAKARRLILRSIMKSSWIVRQFGIFRNYSAHVICVPPLVCIGPTTGSLEDLIRHGLHALRETLQQDKELTINNTSIGIIGLAGEHERNVPPEGPFRILEGEEINVYLQTMVPKDAGEAPAAPPPATEAAEQTGPGPATSDADVQMAED